MRILSIGNSFSHDAHRYLHDIAASEGFDIKTVNLFIGGCSLETHYENYIKDIPAYDLEINGGDSSGKVSIKRVLQDGPWDVVTLQQASHLSMKSRTYYPYITELAKFVRAYCPETKIYIHRTWAYDNDSERLSSVGYSSADEMFNDVKKCYALAAETIAADGTIYSGDAMLTALNRGINVYRDGFHAGFVEGRFLLGLIWCKTFTDNKIVGDKFDRFDGTIAETVRRDLINIANDTV